MFMYMAAKTFVRTVHDNSDNFKVKVDRHIRA